MLDGEAGILLCSVKKIGKVFRIKTQTGQSAMFFCVLGKRERFLVEEMQPAEASKCSKSKEIKAARKSSLYYLMLSAINCGRRGLRQSYRQ